MKFAKAASILFLPVTAIAFSPQILRQRQRQFVTSLDSTLVRPPSTPAVNDDGDDQSNVNKKEEWVPPMEDVDVSGTTNPTVAEVLERGNEEEIMSLLTAESINERLTAQINKMKLKDNTSKVLRKEDLDIVFEDEHIVVINKPAGVLCVPGKGEGFSLSQFVFDNVDGVTLPKADMMVVHRLGFDTTGLMVFSKTMKSLRGMNVRFRTREVDRTYEALLVGHVAEDSGKIDMPLMRCLMYPPFIRVSTKDAQCAIVKSRLRPDEDIGRKYLEEPKGSITEYKVLAREELHGLPVTRVELLSLSGRTHQLNVHCAAFGHPIVGDTTYGIDGEAGPHGGLTLEEAETLMPNPNRASLELQRKMRDAHGDGAMYVHARSIEFDHPIDKRIEISLDCEAPF